MGTGQSTCSIIDDLWRCRCWASERNAPCRAGFFIAHHVRRPQGVEAGEERAPVIRGRRWSPELAPSGVLRHYRRGAMRRHTRPAIKGRCIIGRGTQALGAAAWSCVVASRRYFPPKAWYDAVDRMAYGGAPYVAQYCMMASRRFAAHEWRLGISGAIQRDRDWCADSRQAQRSPPWPPCVYATAARHEEIIDSPARLINIAAMTSPAYQDSISWFSRRFSHINMSRPGLPCPWL